MAAYLVKITCGICSESWKQRLSDEGRAPRYCTFCGGDMEADEQEFVPKAPYVVTGVSGKSGDQVFRAMEAASERRIEMAAEATGIDRSELSDMKVTNIRDDARPGENSVIQPVTEVHKAMDVQKGAPGSRRRVRVTGWADRTPGLLRRGSCKPCTSRRLRLRWRIL